VTRELVRRQRILYTTHRRRRRRRDSTRQLGRVGVGGVYWVWQRTSQFEKKLLLRKTRHGVPAYSLANLPVTLYMYCWCQLTNETVIVMVKIFKNLCTRDWISFSVQHRRRRLCDICQLFVSCRCTGWAYTHMSARRTTLL